MTRFPPPPPGAGFESPFEASLVEMLPLAKLEAEALRGLLLGFNELTQQTALLAQAAQALLAPGGASFDAAEVAAPSTELSVQG